jgi:hypothetical protein
MDLNNNICFEILKKEFRVVVSLSLLKPLKIFFFFEASSEIFFHLTSTFVFSHDQPRENFQLFHNLILNNPNKTLKIISFK